MDKLLLEIEDKFYLKGRGLVLVPSISPEVYEPKQNATTINIRLELPDGSTKPGQAILYFECLYPQGIKTMCYIQNLDKNELPKRTKVWLVDE